MANNADVPWAAEIEHIFNSPTTGEADTAHPLTPEDERALEQENFSIEQLREAFFDGYINNDIDSDDRHRAREAYFEWMEYLGYDSRDFDWDSWREHMGYGKD